MRLEAQLEALGRRKRGDDGLRAEGELLAHPTLGAVPHASPAHRVGGCEQNQFQNGDLD